MATDYRKRNVWRCTARESLGDPKCPYLTRWVLQTPLGSLRLHHWHAGRGDDPRAMHDHSWWFWTLVLWGEYTDMSPGFDPEDITPPDYREALQAGSLRFRSALWKHTVEAGPKGAWTLLLTGPHCRLWGFYENGSWVRAVKYFARHGNHPCS